MKNFVGHFILAKCQAINELSQTLNMTLANMELRGQRRAREDATAMASTPDELAKFMRMKFARCAAIVKVVGVKGQ